MTQNQGGKHQKRISGTGTAENAQMLFQVALGLELLGDAYKKMKKYKLSNQCYEQSLAEVLKVKTNKGQGRTVTA